MRIAAVGAGRMGRGIALAFAYAGHDVALVDLKPRNDWDRLRSEAMEEMRASLAMLAELDAMPADAVPRIMARISAVPASAATVLKESEIIFEAVPETLEAKRDAFARICELAAADAVLASTTSTILVTDLVPMVTRPERLLNAHWLNPAYLIPLVELSTHAGTAAAVVTKMKRLLEDAGKVAVVCGPTPGYIVPRLQALIMNEAARMVEEGVASAEDIDKAVIYGFGFRFAVLGLLEFIDWGGGDILHHASRYLVEALGDSRYAAPDIIATNMREGRIGMKTGQGFMNYEGVDQAAYREKRLAAFAAALRAMGLAREPVA